MIPLIITTPAMLSGWSAARRAETLLLGATGDVPASDGWQQTASLAPDAARSGASSTAFRGSASESSPWHGPACACCTPRPALVSQLLLLYQDRARGNRSFFRHIALVVSADQQASVAAGLRTDAIICSLFSPETEE
ncbi:hypothetical protein [Acetobacter conturbans]|uniref:Uncharacterized protein n=1 Tax=Acetobacter conturbans TaxID=1737472 RepID=A0ABX0JYI2_9PROT|nr:hypothetical protein [Acetobacter conturbans]NHN88388.1 hypothetical protein [Acetobacter conturbans]